MANKPPVLPQKGRNATMPYAFLCRGRTKPAEQLDEDYDDNQNKKTEEDSDH